jgi:hypothetical protein
MTVIESPIDIWVMMMISLHVRVNVYIYRQVQLVWLNQNNSPVRNVRPLWDFGQLRYHTMNTESNGMPGCKLLWKFILGLSWSILDILQAKKVLGTATQ